MIKNERKKERAEKMLNDIFDISIKCQDLLKSCSELENLKMDNFRLIRRLSLETLAEINK